MIKLKSKKHKIEIDLTGPDGNAYYLLAMGKCLSKQLGKNWTEIQAKMTNGDYDNLITVFDTEFGEYVDLLK